MTLAIPRTTLTGLLLLAMALVFLFLVRGDSGAQVVPPKLDHFKCYAAQGPNLGIPVVLEDQFDVQLGIQEQVQVGDPARFCNPTLKFHRGRITPITNPDAHLKLYRIRPDGPVGTVPTNWAVVVDNQFGRGQGLLVAEPKMLAVPTQKLLPGHGPALGVDHFKCYAATGRRPPALVHLRDQFHFERAVKVLEPAFFCNPTVKLHAGVVTPIQNPDAHLVCYSIKTRRPFTFTVQTDNQFGPEVLTLTDANLLCVPSLKVAFKAVPPPVS